LGRYGQWNALQHPLNLAIAAARVWLNRNVFDNKTSLNCMIYHVFLYLHGCQNTFPHTLATPKGSINKHFGDIRMSQSYRAYNWS